MNYYEMQEAVSDAEKTLRFADIATKNIARMLVGRLRKVGNSYHETDILISLKRELKSFNSTTRTWK